MDEGNKITIRLAAKPQPVRQVELFRRANTKNRHDHPALYRYSSRRAEFEFRSANTRFGQPALVSWGETEAPER